MTAQGQFAICEADVRLVQYKVESKLIRTQHLLLEATSKDVPHMLHLTESSRIKQFRDRRISGHELSARH